MQVLEGVDDPRHWQAIRKVAMELGSRNLEAVDALLRRQGFWAWSCDGVPPCNSMLYAERRVESPKRVDRRATLQE
jgi:hypothetical protein